MSAPKHKGHRPRRRRVQEKHGFKRESIRELHPIAEPPQIDSFAEWDLGEETQRAIRAMDISVPTPIQALSIGPILGGRDVIAKAETGTGKTLAFGAPMMSRIDPARSSVLGLVLCPTRELAQQVANVLAALALPRGVKVALVVGGDPMHPQIAALQSGAQVVVGTPGRVLDLYQQRFLSFPWTEFVVLDEADKMFEIGFLDDIKRILSLLPAERQTLLFSATFPSEVLKLARAETRDPVEVATAKGTATVDAITQYYLEVPDEDRPLRLIRLLERSGARDVFLVFCERRTEVDRLMRRLERLSLSIKALHGGYDQASRFRVMSAFRTGEVKALVATDVASRGLDVEHVTHVINFSVPRDLEDYTHRIGRTGRAGRAGIAITFVTPAHRRRWRSLFERMKWPVEELPEGVRPSLRPAARAAPAPRQGADGEQTASAGTAGRAERRGRSAGERGRGERDAGGGRRRAEPQSAERSEREPQPAARGAASEPRAPRQRTPRAEEEPRSGRRAAKSERPAGSHSAAEQEPAGPPDRKERRPRRGARADEAPQAAAREHGGRTTRPPRGAAEAGEAGEAKPNGAEPRRRPRKRQSGEPAPERARSEPQPETPRRKRGRGDSSGFGAGI